MTINIYSTSDDPRKVGKTLTTIASSVTCKPSEPCTILEPRVILNYSSTYTAANYIYISDFDAYYFAEKTLLTGGELLLTCKLDPLQSFSLDNIEVMVIRSESVGVNYATDGKLPIDPSRCWIEGKLFPQQPFDTTVTGLDYLITVNGGGAI